MKNGITFTSVINYNQFKSGIWDPYHYRQSDSSEKLSNYVDVIKIPNRGDAGNLDFAPIEYKDVPKGNILGFNLNKNDDLTTNRLPIIPEETLIFGTMRAYLGNALLTPKSEWISSKNAWFAVNSEFVIINPKDGLKFFWWAFLKSASFLCALPTGTGGTRPRSNPEQLLEIPVAIPSLEIRKEVNDELELISKNYWKQAIKLQNTLSKTGLF
jgi:restriction endonuclease S subunit